MCFSVREGEKEGKVIFNATHCARSLFLTKLSEADISADISLSIDKENEGQKG